MKDYNEMANAVFRRRDEFLTARKKKQALILKAGIPVCSLLLVTLVGVAIWQGGRLPAIPTATEPVETSVSVNDATLATNENTEAVKDDVLNTDDTEAVTDPVENVNPQNPHSNQGNSNSQGGSNSNSQGSSNGNTGNITPDATSATDPPEVKPTGPSTGQNGVVVQPTTASAIEDFTYPPQEPWVTVPCVTEPLERPTRPNSGSADSSGSLDSSGSSGSPGDEYPATSPASPKPPTEPTEPLTGPATITCDGKTYEAYTGDKVTVTTKLYVDKPVKNVLLMLKYSERGIEVENLNDYGFTELQLRKAHFPEFDNIFSAVNYRYIYNSYNRDYNAVCAAVNEALNGLELSADKTFVTFDFIVTRPGELFIEPSLSTVKVEDDVYYCDGGKILNPSGFDVSADVIVTPAALVTPPVPPADEVVENTPFTYPEESFDGDLAINCDGRTYSADVGDTVTYVMELEVDELFETVQASLRYNGEKLSIIKPEKAKESLPELSGCLINYSANNGEELPDKCVKFNAVDIYGVDFRRRKVLVTLEFEVTAAGEVDLGLVIEEMDKMWGLESYFIGSQQVIFEGIDIYEYVIVNSK